MVPQTSVYLGELRCKATHGPSSVELITDAPRDNFGRGESFSPTDLVVTALATCKLTTMAIAAQRYKIALEGSRVYAEKHTSADAPRRIVRIVIKISFPPEVPHTYREKLETIARACPVAKSIHPDITVDVTFSYPD